jgi:hypothetical protein
MCFADVITGQLLHAACFRCSSCQHPIGAKPYLARGASFICQDCLQSSERDADLEVKREEEHERSGRPQCAGCHEDILVVAYRQFHGRSYHTDWFAFAPF